MPVPKRFDVRKAFLISEEQARWLASEAERREVSEGHVIRSLITEAMREQGPRRGSD